MKQIPKTLILMQGKGGSLRQCDHLKFIDRDMSKVYRARERLSQKMLCICFMMPWVHFPVLQTKTKTNKTE